MNAPNTEGPSASSDAVSPPAVSPPALRQVFLSGPVLSVCLVVSLGLLFEFQPRLGALRFFSAPPSDRTESGVESALDPSPDLTVGEAEIAGESRNQPGMATPDSADIKTPRRATFGQEAPLDLPAIEAEASPVELLDPTGKSLDAFFAALTQTQAKQKNAITRIAHFGDSIVVSDYISGTLRRKLQETFGDAGHGYMLIANAWPAYFHNDVFRFATKGFRVSRIVGPVTNDGFYGLGGVTFRADSGLIAQFGTAPEGDFGTRVSHFELSYLASPTGGQFEVSVDGKVHTEVDSKAVAPEVRRVDIDVEDGPHRFELRTRQGESRFLGVVVERRVPGVVLDALGVQGARIRFLDKQDDQHFADELKWRQPNLVVYQFGANESGDGYAYPMDEYFTTMKAVILQGQRALPESSCLIIGAMDRARREDGVITSMKIIQLIVAEQEKAARELGCAYFDTYKAMGGWGSMPAWVKRGLGQADMTHPTGVGAIRIGTWIYGAMMKRYGAYLKERGTPR